VTSPAPILTAYDAPDEGEPRATLVLAHGAGGDHRAALLAAMAKNLPTAGIAVARFDFPYRAAGRKLPDPMAKLVPAYREAAEAARARAPSAPLFIGGKSMGGRAATHLAAEGFECRGVVLLGYPLHPAGKKERLRDAHLPDVPVPMLFVTGTRDDLCDLELLRPVLARCGGRAELLVVDDGDHSLEVRKASGRSAREVLGEIAGAITSFVLSPHPR
jgi:predicted alpha/beta-hydrolase family hydrolase